MWNFRLNYLSQSLLYFPLSLDLGFLHVIRALKLSRAILNHSFSIFCRNSHNNPLSSQNLTFLPNWSHWSVSDLKIGKTQFPDHLSRSHAPPRVTQSFESPPRATTSHVSDLLPPITKSSTRHLRSIDQPLIYRKKSGISASSRVATLRPKFRSSDPCEAPLSRASRAAYHTHVPH